jgi:hypothetical protein
MRLCICDYADYGIRMPSPATIHAGSTSSRSSRSKLSCLSSLALPVSRSNCSEECLKSVARQSDESFVFEAVLRAKLQQPACTASRDAAPSLGNVLFVVMCSTDLPQQVADMMQGWMHWVPPGNLILLCGGEIPGLNVTLLPRLAIDDAVDARFKQPSGKAAANLRDLRSIWWLVNVVPNVLRSHDWIFYVDDDTFVNLPLLLSFLHGIPTHLPLLFHIFTIPRCHQLTLKTFHSPREEVVCSSASLHYNSWAHCCLRRRVRFLRRRMACPLHQACKHHKGRLHQLPSGGGFVAAIYRQGGHGHGVDGALGQAASTYYGVHMPGVSTCWLASPTVPCQVSSGRSS